MLTWAEINDCYSVLKV